MPRALSYRNGPADHLLARCAVLVWLILLWGCSSTSSSDSVGADAQVISLPGGRYLLHAVEHAGEGTHALVFIEGDGRPWRAGGRIISDDPTPRNTPMHDRMLRAQSPALYLGRPCYFQKSSPDCSFLLWTFARYSQTVVDSMHGGLLYWLEQHPHVGEVTLVGHSGGGVLALLLAEKVPQARKVIAIAAPLDIDAWADLHGYERLFGSLNPAQQEQWRPNVSRLLVFGRQDSEVPPDLFARVAHNIPGARVLVVEDAGHGCCQDYQKALKDLTKR